MLAKLTLRAEGARHMRYIVRAKNSEGHGSLSVILLEPREALRTAREMAEDGTSQVEILAEDGMAYDLLEFERITGDGEGP
jgi:hypothetical protein